jgi:solute carrier family 26 (sodium-independent sulfate anion transporter), member 11
MPTIIGFTTSATITIASGQVKSLLGIKSGSSNEFIEAWKNVFEHLDEIKLSDSALGVISFVLLMLMKNASSYLNCPSIAKYLSISRNAIIVILGMIIAYIFHVNGQDPFRLTGKYV